MKVEDGQGQIGTWRQKKIFSERTGHKTGLSRKNQITQPLKEREGTRFDTTEDFYSSGLCTSPLPAEIKTWKLPELFVLRHTGCWEEKLASSSLDRGNVDKKRKRGIP